MSTYVYEALPGQSFVRVLILHPASSRDEPLECDLVLFDRDDVSTGTWPDASYDAVSYVWGEPNFTHHITSRSSSTRLPITQNVDTMLRYLRKKESQCRLWLDAICINQADDDEKSVQVSIMGQIYRRARKTHVWLGEGDGDTATVFSVLHAFAGATSQSGSSAKRRYVPPGIVEKMRDCTPQKLFNFLHHPWFRRRWVIQEVALSHDVRVHIGDKTISWLLVTSGLERMVQQYDIVRPDNEARLALTTIKYMHRFNGDLLTLIWHLDYAQCSDPRDRFYALLPILSEQYPGIPLPVEYKQHWTGLFLRVANFEFSENLLWHRIAFGGLSDLDSSLPSWVPNWSRQRKYLGHDDKWHAVVHGMLLDANSRENSRADSLKFLPIWEQPGSRIGLLKLRGRMRASSRVVWHSWPRDASTTCLSNYLRQGSKDLARAFNANSSSNVGPDCEREARIGIRTLIFDVLDRCNLSEYRDQRDHLKFKRGIWQFMWKRLTIDVFLWMLGLLTIGELQENVQPRWRVIDQDIARLFDNISSCLSHWTWSESSLEHLFELLGANSPDFDRTDLETMKYTVGNSIPLLSRHLELFMTETTLFCDSHDSMWLGPADMRRNDIAVDIGKLSTDFHKVILRPVRSVDFRAMHPRSSVGIWDGLDTVYRLIGVCVELRSKSRGKTGESTPSDSMEPSRIYAIV